MLHSRKSGHRLGQAKVPKVCLISLYSYPLFNPDCHSPFGGAEVRMSLIAKELARRGHFQVSVVVLDHGQPTQTYDDALTIYPHSGYAGYPLTPQGAAPIPEVSFPEPPPLCFGRARWMYKRLCRLLFKQPSPEPLPESIGQLGAYVIDRQKIAVYDEIDADIYMLAGCSNLSAELAFYCQQRNKTYIFLSASDGDYQPTFKEQPPDTVLYYGSIAHLLVYAIRHATIHVVQNERQAQLLQEHYGRDSLIVKNPLDLTRTFPKEAEPDTILWIGKADRVKRPEILLELARHCPEYHFTMLLAFSDPDIFAQCMAEANALPNVTITDYVPFHEVERYFARAKLFVNTSVFEGFPNTFLQAAKYAVPLVSLQVDPGEMLSRHRCGLLCAGDFERLKENVGRLMTALTLHTETSARCIEYVRMYHDKENIIPQCEILLTTLLASRQRGLNTFKEKRTQMNLVSILPRQLRRLKEMSQENRAMQARLALLERHVETSNTLERHRAERQLEIIAQQELLEQKVRFLVAENIRLNQLLRELIYLNDLQRTYTGSQTKESFDYQWREVGDGQWMPSNPPFLHTTPDLIVERTQLPREWFPGKRVLDAGCGSGRWTYGLLKLGAHVTACDQSQGGLAATRALVEREGLGPVKFYQKDLLRLDLEPDSFDLVWCFGVAHHTENPMKVLKNLIAVIAPGGWLFMMLYGFPESADAFREQAMYEEWRRRLLPLSLSEKVDILKQHYSSELVHGYFDAYSPPINDLFTWEWIQNFFQNEGFVSVHRTIQHPNHHFVARKIG